MKTVTITPKASDVKRAWHHLSAKDQILGRLASEVAQKLMGKHKTYYVPNIDCGDYVVVTDAKGIIVTGNKLLQKTYTRYSGFPGGLRTENLKDMLARDATKVFEHAVRGMLPENKLRDSRMNRLKVFEGEKHPYQDKLKEE